MQNIVDNALYLPNHSGSQNGGACWVDTTIKFLFRYFVIKVALSSIFSALANTASTTL